MKQTAAHRVVTETAHNRVPDLQLAQQARDEHEDLFRACVLAKRLIDKMRGEGVWQIQRADADHTWVALASAIRSTQEGCSEEDK